MAEFQFFPLIVNDTAVGEINGKTIDLKTNGETAIGGGFILGVTTGVLTVGIKATSATPIRGHTIDLMTLLISNTEVIVGFPYNGDTYILPMKLTEISHKEEAKNGMVTGDFTFTQSGSMEKI